MRSFGLANFSLFTQNSTVMKDFILPLLITILSSFSIQAYAQCPPGDITFNNQIEINTFLADYPNCTTIPGNLKIGGASFVEQSDIDNIAQLAQITSIGGDLLIVFNSTDLINLHGLEQLTHVSGNVHVFHNSALADLNALSQITTIGGNLNISGNSALNSIDGLKKLTTVGANMDVTENPVLTRLNSFSKLQSVGGYLSIWGNAVLSDVNDLHQLISINGNLSVTQNHALTNLHGLRQLAVLGGDLNINQNINLTDLGNLTPKMTPTATLRVAHNFNLSDCAVQTICEHISSGGPIEVIGNGAGCSSVLELENACATNLPVELSNFTAKVIDKSIELVWYTETETNNDGFAIQRSKDAIDWNKVGWERGKGNSTTLQKYTFTDEQPLLGKSYYRLAQIDMDGKIEYSNVLTVTYYADSVTVYPNPVNDILQLSIMDELPIEEVIIYNTSGREMLREVPSSSTLNVSKLPRGTYILGITIQGDTIHKRILIQ